MLTKTLLEKTLSSGHSASLMLSVDRYGRTLGGELCKPNEKNFDAHTLRTRVYLYHMYYVNFKEGSNLHWTRMYQMKLK